MECGESCIRIQAEPDTSTSDEIGSNMEERQIAAVIALVTLAVDVKTVEVDFSVKAGFRIGNTLRHKDVECNLIYIEAGPASMWNRLGTIRI
jgi:hypothetical protein